jgi:TfoX/Sxy family transcriptional regulator of competence genes
MAYDEALAARVRTALARTKGVVEKKMFGGIAFMVRGHMCVGVLKDHLMLKLGEEGAAEALAEPHTRWMDFTGKPSKSMIYVDPPGFAGAGQLKAWVRKAVEFAESLPVKAASVPKARSAPKTPRRG